MVTTEDGVVITEICEHLDGIPLAIELAAARVRSLTVRDIANGLGDRFRVLHVGERDRTERHQTLHAAVNWSYQLLDDGERCLFDRLTVFPGSFDAAAAGAVCGHEPLETHDVVDVLGRLVDKSMVVVDRSGATARFSQLETLRQLGVAHLSAAAAAEDRRRHLAHFNEIAKGARADLTGRFATRGRSLFRHDWHNLRAAMQCALANADVTIVCELLEAVFWYGEASGLQEVGAWAEAVTEIEPSASLPWGIAAFFASLRGDYDEARRMAGTGIAAAAANDPASRWCWQALQLAHWYSGRPQDAWAAQMRFISLVEATGDPFEISFAHAVAGGTASWSGETSAEVHLAEAARVAAPIANPTLEMWIDFMTGADAYAEQRFDTAFTRLQRAAALAAQADCPTWEFRAQLLTYALAGRLQRDDTDQLGREILSRVYAARSWSEILPAVLYTFVHWTSVGRITPAAVLLGYLDRHDVHHSIGVAARQQAADVIHQHPEASASIAIGRSLDRDELVAYTLEHLSRADLDVVAGPE